MSLGRVVDKVLNAIGFGIRLIKTLIMSAAGCLMLWMLFFSKTPTRAERLKDYVPEQSVLELSRALKLTAWGRDTFYLAKPKIVDQTRIRNSCGYSHHNTLGCYSPKFGIFLLDTSAAKAAGAMETAAAHELLHAGFLELSQDEIDTFSSEVKKIAAFDPEVQKRLDLYKNETERTRVSEMHSIIGTEQETLTPFLEVYYRRYFESRKLVVQMSREYQRTLKLAIEQVNKADDDLSKLRRQIETLDSALREQQSDIHSLEVMLVAARSDIEEYNGLVHSYNSRIANYKLRAENLKRLVSSFNRQVKVRNENAESVRERVGAMNTLEDAFEISNRDPSSASEFQPLVTLKPSDI